MTLELKKSTAEKERACRTLCALANGQGGLVVFGVTPSGKVVGQKVTDRTLEDLISVSPASKAPVGTSFSTTGNIPAMLLHSCVGPKGS